MFGLLLMLIQPGIILYDRLVMQQAAAEACRVLISSDGSQEDMRLCEDYVRRRLSAVPQHDCFHVHAGSCSWDIRLVGSSASSGVSASISNEVKPLPLFDAAAALLGAVNERGNLEVQVQVDMEAQPAWFANAGLGSGGASWAGAWLS